MTKLTLAGLLAGSCLLGSATGLRAQDGPPPGGFDPAQMRQRMLDRLHDQLEVKDEAEWKLIAERIQKVMEARRTLGGPGGFGMMGPGGRPPRPDGAGPGPNGPPPGGPDQPAAPDGAPGPGGPGGPGGFNRTPPPEIQALRKALDAKASPAELKTKLAEARAAREQKEADLAKAQDELKQLLSVRQEAVAVMFGLVK
ncbi:MAG TPA: hypothetical protein VNZ64_16545 [Candidatus Acidoferrum sp.]|nr:hypothetical protein [Candidatus Acidoferrum sp.]